MLALVSDRQRPRARTPCAGTRSRQSEAVIDSQFVPESVEGVVPAAVSSYNGNKKPPVPLRGQAVSAAPLTAASARAHA